LAEPGTIYVSGETFKLTEGLFRFEALGDKKVKGKQAPVAVYRVIAPSSRKTRFDVNAERGLTPFVGRERELELMLDGFKRATSDWKLLACQKFSWTSFNSKMTLIFSLKSSPWDSTAIITFFPSNSTSRNF